MSDTPRSDAAEVWVGSYKRMRPDGCGYEMTPMMLVRPEVARDMERELAAVTAERDALREDLMVERAWHRFEVAVEERDDLVIILKRLAGAVARTHPARAAAIEYIRRHGLMSPLRDKEGA